MTVRRHGAPDLYAVEVAYEVRRVVHVWAHSGTEAKEAARHPSDWMDADPPHEFTDTIRVPREPWLGGEAQ